jgi:hypothetical protein
VAVIHSILTLIFVEDTPMLIEIQREILQTLQAQKRELMQIQKEMLQALKAAMSCCRSLKCKTTKGMRHRPLPRVWKEWIKT